MKQERGQITREKGVVSKRRRLASRGQAIYFYRKGKHAGPPRATSYLPWSAASEQKDNGFSLPAACLTVSTLPQPGPTLHPQATGTAETAHTACACPFPAPREEQMSPGNRFHRQSRYTDLFQVQFPHGGWMTPGPQSSG